jgi:creatinine amidohydrolase
VRALALHRVRSAHSAIVRAFADMTWEEVASCDKSRFVAVLPIGATEAHGPHLPLSTDVLISTAMAEAGAVRLERAGYMAAVMPALAYSAARFAAGFAGTISLRPETETALLVDLGRALAAHHVQHLVFANAHLDPEHIAAIYAAQKELSASTALRVIFPDVTRKPWALRLSDEFKSGACHAGCYEGSMVMAVRPSLVRESIRGGLSPNPASLSVAIREGKHSFEEAGGARAYFGDPARATAQEGRDTIEILGQILHDAFIEVREAP